METHYGSLPLVPPLVWSVSLACDWLSKSATAGRRKEAVPEQVPLSLKLLLLVLILQRHDFKYAIFRSLCHTNLRLAGRRTQPLKRKGMGIF